jgi:cytochrome c biogenesis protein CcdA
MNLLTFSAAFAAGILTVLSPCVLPILPIVFGAASSERRFGPVALAGGVAVSFTIVGLFIALVGFSLGIDETVFHRVVGVLLVAFGLVLLTPWLQHGLEAVLRPFSGWAGARITHLNGSGLLGQAGLGVALGAVWSPCVGPTLGAASVLASQGKNLPAVFATMMLFGIGAALPLLGIGMASRATLQRFRGGLGGAGRWGKWVLGAGMFIVGALALSGADKTLEGLLVEASPAWLTHITTML